MGGMRFALLGTGAMALLHGRSLLGEPETRITALCGTSVEKARALGEKLGIEAACYDAFGRMLEAGGFDALVIAIPPYAHDGQFEAAAARGIPICVEKPVALDSERAHSMVAAARDAGIVTEVGYQMQGLPSVARLRAACRSGEAGRPTLFQGRYFANHLHKPWWRDLRRSGGQVLEQAIHVYNLATTFCGRAVAVSGFLENLCHREIEDYTVEDTSAGLIHFENGAIATVSASNCAIPMRWEAAFTLVCEHLTAELRPGTGGVFIRTADGQAEEATVSERPQDGESMMRHFVKRLRGEAEPWAPIEAAAHDLEIALAVKRSAAAGGALQTLPALSL